MTGALKLFDLSYRTCDGVFARTILSPVTHRFSAGELHVITGPSGSGKTTLLSLMALAMKPSSGVIRFGDVTLTSLDEVQSAQWRRYNLGILHRSSRVISTLDVASHVRLAACICCDDAMESRAHALLEQLGLSEQLSLRPDQLSADEKQRVALAQVLAARPPVVLADEPTAVLDCANAALVAQTLRAYARDSGAVVICASHDTSLIDAADAVLHLARPDADSPMLRRVGARQNA